MIIEEPGILAEYERWSKQIGPHDPYRDDLRLGIDDVIRAHFLIADFFYSEGHGMGGIGPKDINLLHSALHRQHASYGGQFKWEAPLEVAATLFYGLIKDHPFHDANKRTAFLTLLFQLQNFGLVPTVSKKELEDFAVAVAEDAIRKHRRFQDLDKKVDDPHVQYIAHYLKSNTRKIDKRYYCVTYKKLKSILNKYGYDLQNPIDNHIDIVRIFERKKIFGFGVKETIGVKVTQIGFPGWSKQVGKGAINSVRKATNLVYEKGVDSSSFYDGTDPIECLITEYSEPLLRLANR